jgi:uncharacterized protein YjiS (DUF1127 family)
MATTEYFHPRETSGEKLGGVAAIVFARVAGAWRAFQNRRSVAKLLEWDHHMLRDIGLTEGDVRSAMSMPVSSDPSFRLDALAEERRVAFRAQARERQAKVKDFRFESGLDRWKRI